MQLLEEQRLNDTYLLQQYFLVALYHLSNKGEYESYFKKHVNLKLLQTPQKKGSYTEIYRLSALHKYYAMKGEVKKLHETGMHIMQCEELLWRNNKSETNTENLLIAINNFLVTSVELGRFAESEEAIRLLDQIPIHNEKIRHENTIRYIHIKQPYFWATGDHGKGCRFSQEMLQQHKFLDNFFYQQSKITAIHLYSVLFAISVGEYKKAVVWLSVFNTYPKAKMLPQTIKSVELLHIILQYEMQNFDLLKQMSMSALKRLDNLTEQEEAFLKVFSVNYKTQKALLLALAATSFSFSIEPSLFISDWVQSKVQKMPLSKIVRQRYTSRQE